MKILILAPYPWCKDNSFGNTYSSIFGRVDNIEIAHVFLYNGIPDQASNVVRYYQVPENEVVRSVVLFWKRGKGAGKEILIEGSKSASRESSIQSIKPSLYQRLLSFGKRKHWGCMFFAREVAWKLGKVNYGGLLEFISDFGPDIFFLPYNNVYYTNRLAHFIKQNVDIPMVMEMGMDHYSLKRISWNPFFWADRLIKRKMIRKLARESEMLFVISRKLKEELEDSLHVPCRILYKTPDVNREYKPYVPSNAGKIRYLFTGNIYANRWKSLAMLANELQKQGDGKLDIYTATPISTKMSKALNIAGISELHASVSQEKVIELQNNADILVHAEAFDKYNKMLVRCAISTKIMDYLSVGRCILAIGPSDIASIEYLTDNDLALSASNESQLTEIVSRVIADHSIIDKYAIKGREYSTQKLNATEMRKALYNDLMYLISNYKTSKKENEYN